MSPLLRRSRRDLAASEGPALEIASPAALRERDTERVDDRPREGVTVAVEDGRGSAAASGPDGDESLAGAEWRSRFSSAEEMWEALRNRERQVGLMSNDLGAARRQLRLFERTIELIAGASDPVARVAFVTAGRLIREEAALDSVEAMVSAAEADREAHEQEVARAVRA